MDFEKWINTLGAYMQLHGFIKNDEELNSEAWKSVYYDEGFTPEQTLVEEFGTEWHLHKPKN